MPASCSRSFADVSDEGVFDGYRNALGELGDKLRVCSAREANRALAAADDGGLVVFNALPDPSCNIVDAPYDVRQGVSDDAERHERCAVYCAHAECSAAARFMAEHRDWLGQHCSEVLYLHEGVKGLRSPELEPVAAFGESCSIRPDDRIELPGAEAPAGDAHLHGRNVVITGGTRGLGRLQAFHALEAGASHVTITGRAAADGGTPLDGERTQAELDCRFPGRVAYVPADVRREADNDRIFNGASRRAHGLPAEVHSASLNAGIFGPAGDDRRIDRLPASTFAEVLATNCDGVRSGIKAFVNGQPGVEDKKVVALKSIYGSQGSAFSNAAYQASKFCVDGLVKQATASLARADPAGGLPHAVQINSVSPAFSRSAMTGAFYSDDAVNEVISEAHPTGTWVDPHDIAKSVVFLLNAPRGVRGVDLAVDNGVMANSIPDFADTTKIKAVTEEPCCGKEA